MEGQLFFILVLFTGVIQQTSSDLHTMTLNCSPTCRATPDVHIQCFIEKGIYIADVVLLSQVTNKTTEETLETTISNMCNTKAKCERDEIVNKSSTILSHYDFANVTITYQCKPFNDDVTTLQDVVIKNVTYLKEPTYIVARPTQKVVTKCYIQLVESNKDMTINFLHLQFNESALSENDTIQFVACNKTWEYNSFNRTLPRKLTCPRLEMEVRLTLGVFWLEIDAKGHFQINCILDQQDTETDRHTEEQGNRDLILVLVGVVAALIISLILGLCGVYVYRMKFQKTDRPTPTLTEDSHSVGQAQPFNNEPSTCVDTSTGTQPISPSADCYSLATLAVAANHDTDPNLTSVKLIDDCYSTCSVVTSQSDHDSHLSSRPDATSLPRHSHTPVADQQVVTSKHDAASKQCLDSAPRDLQTVEYHRKYQSTDDVYSNNQSEGDCLRFSSALQKGNSQSRKSNQPALDDSNTTPHKPPLANSTVYNSLNSLDGTYTHLKHVNPPERVIDNVYDG